MMQSNHVTKLSEPTAEREQRTKVKNCNQRLKSVRWLDPHSRILGRYLRAEKRKVASQGTPNWPSATSKLGREARKFWNNQRIRLTYLLTFNTWKSSSENGHLVTLKCLDQSYAENQILWMLNAFHCSDRKLLISPRRSPLPQYKRKPRSWLRTHSPTGIQRLPNHLHRWNPRLIIYSNLLTFTVNQLAV